MSNWPIVSLVWPSNIVALILMLGVSLNAFSGIYNSQPAITPPIKSVVGNATQYMASRSELQMRLSLAFSTSNV